MNAKEIKVALADEGVQAAIEKQVAKAVKAETKRCLDVVKEAVDENKGTVDKDVKAATAAFLKNIAGSIKG